MNADPRHGFDITPWFSARTQTPNGCRAMVGVALLTLALGVIGCGVPEEDTPPELGSSVEELSAEFNKYAVGVIPIDPNTCAGDRTVTIYTDDEDDDNESDSSNWDLPQTIRRARRHDTDRTGTVWKFCKVDGRDFKSLTKFESKTHYFYATLKLGLYCPNGSVELTHFSDGEHDDNRSSMAGPASPNYVSGSVTHMHFCMFGASTDKMTSFPDLEMEYAVFHDYDGPQPDLFFKKKWIYSDDEDYRNYSGGDNGDDSDAFGLMVSGTDNSMYDLAQVQ